MGALQVRWHLEGKKLLSKNGYYLKSYWAFWGGDAKLIFYTMKNCKPKTPFYLNLVFIKRSFHTWIFFIVGN